MNKLLATFAVAGLVGLTACAEDDEPVIMEEPVVEEPAPAPVVTEPAQPTATQDDSLMTNAPGATDAGMTDTNAGLEGDTEATDEF